jgi:hypothetical protein
MEIAIERMTGIMLFVVALSHLLQPAGWTEYFAQLRAKGAPGGFINGMMSLALGALIVGFHGDQWSGWPAIVTVIGWAQVVKGMLHMSFPAYSLKSMELVRAEKSYRFVIAGAVMLPLAALILIVSYR